MANLLSRETMSPTSKRSLLSLLSPEARKYLRLCQRYLGEPLKYWPGTLEEDALLDRMSDAAVPVTADEFRIIDGLLLPLYEKLEAEAPKTNQHEFLRVWRDGKWQEEVRCVHCKAEKPARLAALAKYGEPPPAWALGCPVLRCRPPDLTPPREKPKAKRSP